MTIQFPQINLNGTNGNELLQENMDAYAAVNNAIDYLSKVTVHGRDYQTLSGGAYYAARQEHLGRIAKLESVRADLAAIAAEISRQLRERLDRQLDRESLS